MKRIVFESMGSVGHFDVPDDAVLRVPKSIVLNVDEGPEEPLLPPGQVGTIDVMNPIVPGPKGTEEPPLLPNIQ